MGRKWDIYTYNANIIYSNATIINININATTFSVLMHYRD